MAQSKKTNTKGKGKGKGKDYEVVPDFSADFMTENGATVELTLYDNGDKQDRVKLVIGGAFIICCSAVVVKSKREKYAFLSYPSFYSKKFEKFFNQAYCFEKSLIEEINEQLTDYYFNYDE